MGSVTSGTNLFSCCTNGGGGKSKVAPTKGRFTKQQTKRIDASQKDELQQKKKIALLLSLTPSDEVKHMKRYLKKYGYANAVAHLWYDVFGPEVKLDIETAVWDHDTTNPYYQLFFIDFEMKEFFKKVNSHRRFVTKLFQRLRQYFTEAEECDVTYHNVTLFTLSQAVGFTMRDIHQPKEPSSSKIIDTAWKEALYNHSWFEPHIPKNSDETMWDMDQRHLEMSLLGMGAQRWEYRFGGREDTHTADIMDLPLDVLDRFKKGADRRLATKIIEIIQMGERFGEIKRTVEAADTKEQEDMDIPLCKE